jgi:UMF1 family MFS transporter
VTRAEKSWILYDVGNSAFVLVIVTAIMPIFFKEFAARGMAAELSTAWWGYANSFSALLLALFAPLLGSCADYQGWKKRLFALFLTFGITSTALLYFSAEGAWLYCLGVFVIARTGWAGANVFYDAFITDISEHREMDRVSAAGYAWGYIGSIIPFLLIIALIMTLQKPDAAESIPALAAQLGFVIVALWWLLFSLPMLRHVRQIHFVPPAPRPLRSAWHRVVGTLRQLSAHRNAFTFLLAYFFFIDGIDTIITMAVVYGVDIGISSTALILAILTIQVIAFPCTLFWGHLAKFFPAKRLLQAGIAIYCLITLLAFLLPSLASLEDKTMGFWLLAVLVATSMGGMQALSRSFYGRLIPPEQSGEFFSFYEIFGKFAAIIGPFLVGFTGQMSGDSRYGVLSVLLLFLTGSMILTQVKEVT